MLESDKLKDPLLLHFLFVKRQPFVISGFLDSDEFSVLKDYVPQCSVQLSMNPFDEGGDKEEGMELLSQLLESESEDVIEGEKLAVLVHQASNDDLKMLSTSLQVGWMASSVLSPGEIVRKFKVPVYDLKTLEWLNFDPSILDLSWEEKMLGTLTGMELRMQLKHLYHETTYLAIKLLNGDGNGELLQRVEEMKKNGEMQVALDLLQSYFGLNGADLPGVDEYPREEIEDATVNPREKPLKQTLIYNFNDEFAYLSKNRKFRKFFVKILDLERVDGSHTRPGEKYRFLRGEGPWKDGLPLALLKEWLLDILVNHCDDMSCAKEMSLEFERYITTFNVTTADAMQPVINKCLDEFLEIKSPALDQRRKMVYSPLIEQGLEGSSDFFANPGMGDMMPRIAGKGLNPRPKNPAYAVQWMKESLERLKIFFLDAKQCLRTIEKGNWLVPGKVKAYTNYELVPSPGNRATGDLLNWMGRKVKDVTAFFTQLESYLEEQDIDASIATSQGGTYQ